MDCPTTAAAYAREAGSRGLGDRRVLRGNVRGAVVYVLATRSAADGAVVGRTPVSAHDSERSTDECSQSFQRGDELRIRVGAGAVVTVELAAREMSAQIAHGASQPR